MSLLKLEPSIIKRSLTIAWPAILESFFVNLASLIDSLMVSTLGASAVAAVGITTQPKFVAMAPFWGVGVAVSALVARRNGEQRKEDANTIFATFLVFVTLCILAISSLFVTFTDPILRLCGSNADTHGPAATYFRIIVSGLIFNIIQVGINSAQRGAGNTRITMTTNLVSSGVNVLFNYLLIGGHLGFPALGIRGAAIATVLGTVVACILSIASVCRKNNFVSIPLIIRRRLRPTWQALKSLLSIGYGIILEQLLMRVGFMLTAIMAADQGTNPMAAHQVGMNILSLTFSFGDGLQAAAVALIGYSLGAKEPEKAWEYGRTCRIIGFVLSVLISITYLLGGRWLYGLFFTDASVIDIGVGIMRIMCVICFVQVAQVIYNGCLRGAGDTLYTAISSTISVTIIRTLFSYLGAYVLGLGILGIWCGILADQVSRYLFSSIRFRQGKWIRIKI